MAGYVWIPGYHALAKCPAAVAKLLSDCCHCDGTAMWLVSLYACMISVVPTILVHTPSIYNNNLFNFLTLSLTTRPIKKTEVARWHVIFCCRGVGRENKIP